MKEHKTLFYKYEDFIFKCYEIISVSSDTARVTEMLKKAQHLADMFLLLHFNKVMATVIFMLC